MKDKKSLCVLLLSIIVLLLAPAGAGSYTSGGATLGANSGSYGEVVSTTDNLASTVSAGSTGPIDLNIYKKAVRSDGVFAEADLQVDQGIVNSYTASAISDKVKNQVTSKATLNVNNALYYYAAVDAGRYINSPTLFAGARIEGYDGSLKGWSGSAYAKTNTAGATESFTKADGSSVYLEGLSFTPSKESNIYATVFDGFAGTASTTATATLADTTTVDLSAHVEGALNSHGSATGAESQDGDSLGAPVIADLGLHADTPTNVWGTSKFYVNPLPPVNGIQDAVNAAWDGDQINLASGNYFEQGIQVDKDLTIQGTSSNDVTLFGQGARLFDILPAAKVAMYGMALTDGVAIDGGAIYNAGDLTVGPDMAFVDNYATRYGGAIYNAGTLTTKDALFYSNTADWEGGAIFNDGAGTATIAESLLEWNDAQGGAPGAWGGAISNYGTMTVVQSELENNYAYDGGAIINWGVLDVLNSYLHNNWATSPIQGGGAIYNLGTATVGSSTLVQYNSAAEGGAFYNTGILDIRDSANVNNNYANNGGAIYNDFGSVTVRAGAKVNSNQASGSGGAIYNNFGSVDVGTGAQINANQAIDGGAIYNEEGSVTVRSNAQVNSNNAVGDGGAIYSTGSSAAVNVIENAQINSNVAYLGGSLFNVGGSTATMSDSAQMRYNAAGFGGAVWNGYAGSSFTMNGNAWLDHNTATDNGGAIINTQGATTTLNGNSRLSYNQAQASWGLGGAILNVYDGATLTINDAVSIDHNAAAVNGGAIFNEDATVVMNGGKISYNQAPKGGAIYNNGATAILDLRHGEIDHNTATVSGTTGGRGGAIYNYEGQVNLNTGSGTPLNIWYNTADTASDVGQGNVRRGLGGGIYNTGSSAFSPGVVNIGTNAFITHNTAWAQGGSGIANYQPFLLPWGTVAGTITNVNSNSGTAANQIRNVAIA